MAQFSFLLVSRLPLYPDGWQSSRPISHVPEFGRGLPPRGSLARCSVELRNLGIDPWIFLVAGAHKAGAHLTRGPAPLSWCYTMTVVMLGWVFFRAESLQRALAYLAAMGGFYAGDRTAPSPSAWLTP